MTAKVHAGLVVAHCCEILHADRESFVAKRRHHSVNALFDVELMFMHTR